MLTEPKINPTVLAKECGIIDRRMGEGDGRLINWETFWELVEKRYYKNKCLRMAKNANT